MVGASALNLRYILSFTYESDIYRYFEGAAYIYSVCYPNSSDKEYLIETLVTYFIGIWIPMFLTAIVYFLMYFRLMKHSEIRRNSFSQDSSAQLTKISRTFTIVLIVFYICYLPFTILFTWEAWSLFVGRNIDYEAAHTALIICTGFTVHKKLHESYHLQ